VSSLEDKSSRESESLGEAKAIMRLLTMPDFRARPLAFPGKLRYSPYETTGESMDKTRLDLFRGTLDVLILKSLIWGPLHGYSISDFIRRQSDEVLLVEEGTLYPALWRLETKGLLDAEWGLSENNRKAKFYRLTAKGRRQLRLEVQTWDAYAIAVAKVLGATQPPLPENMR
jgi:PadR family transcriptional regulator, regulatory protein PadR